MSYPSAGAYSEAVQNPRIYFKDPDLKMRSAAVDAFRLPIVLSGGFACTYKFVGPAGNVAVRCFHTEIPNLFLRYKEISAFLSGLRSRFFVDFEYRQDGVTIDGVAYPVVRMEWVEGETMLGHVQRLHGDRRALAGLREELLAFGDEAKARGYAHGDVQPRNLMITPQNKLKLVDYDGMYVPALKGLSAANNGHPNFQSPLRTAADFGPRMDEFSLRVIDLSLEALQHRPELFAQFNDGENLLLSKEDFLNPAQSPAFKAIEAIPGLRPRVQALVAACTLPAPASSPAVADLWKRQTHTAAPSSVWVRGVGPRAPGPAPAPLPPARRRIRPLPVIAMLLAVSVFATIIHYASGPGDRVARDSAGTIADEADVLPPVELAPGPTVASDPSAEAAPTGPPPTVVADQTVSCPEPSGKAQEPSAYPAVDGYVEYVYGDTAEILVSGQLITLAWIDRFWPVPTKLEALLKQCQPWVHCVRVPDSRAYKCLFEDGVSLARVAILHGAARASQDAERRYQCAQQVALAQRVGVWSRPSVLDEAVRRLDCS